MDFSSDETSVFIIEEKRCRTTQRRQKCVIPLFSLFSHVTCADILYTCCQLLHLIDLVGLSPLRNFL